MLKKKKLFFVVCKDKCNVISKSLKESDERWHEISKAACHTEKSQVKYLRTYVACFDDFGEIDGN